MKRHNCYICNTKTKCPECGSVLKHMGHNTEFDVHYCPDSYHKLCSLWAHPVHLVRIAPPKKYIGMELGVIHEASIRRDI
jgi:hypothetical protein